MTNICTRYGHERGLVCAAAPRSVIKGRANALRTNDSAAGATACSQRVRALLVAHVAARWRHGQADCVCSASSPCYTTRHALSHPPAAQEGHARQRDVCRSSSEKWQKRLFVAKDGFLLYYAPTTPVEQTHFDTKPKGVIPLGGCKTEVVERGPKGARFGLKISHPDFYAGRMLILAAETVDEQRAWLEALNDCSKVTMENAKLGDATIEKLRSAGTAAEREKADALEKLQAQAMALKNEQEEKLRLEAAGETWKAMAAEAEERAKKKEEEMAGALAEMERRRLDLETQAGELQSAVAERAAALAGANAEYERTQAMLAAAKAGVANGAASAGASGGASSLDLADIERRARSLEDEKLRLEREKLSLERSVRDLTASSAQMQSTLSTVEAQRKRLEDQLQALSSEETDLSKERQIRRRLERKLQIAEESLKRLDSALRKSGVKLDVDVFADVKTLLSFFEERVDDVRRDAERIDIMKKALKAKRRYLVAASKTDMGEGLDIAEEAWEDEEEDKPAAASASASSKAVRASVAAAPAPAAAAASSPQRRSIVAAKPTTAVRTPPAAAAATPRSSDEGWGDDDDSDTGKPAAAPAAIIPDSTFDDLGPLAPGWTVQLDPEGDKWYFHAASGATSWYRPNADGTVPAA